MRNRSFSLCLALAVVLAACAGPTPVEQHFGEAQRNAIEAMTAAGKAQPGSGIDGAGAYAAYGSYTKALETPAAESDLPEVMFNFEEPT